jgi:hypothetical protein
MSFASGANETFQTGRVAQGNLVPSDTKRRNARRDVGLPRGNPLDAVNHNIGIEADDHRLSPGSLSAPLARDGNRDAISFGDLRGRKPGRDQFWRLAISVRRVRTSDLKPKISNEF